jgi:alpha-L-rhamnosidase
MHYREKVFRPELAWSGEDPETGARYLAAGTDDQFAALEISGLRYLHLVVHADQPVSVTLKRLEVREYLYPRTGRAYFRSDDPQLDVLYQAGIRTVQLNSLDSYTDCPTREQRAWVGDAVVHQMVDLATNEDWGLARNYLELSDSPRPDAILPMVVGGDIESSGGLTIPDWSLSWIHGLHIQYWHDGDLEIVRRHLPTAERVLRYEDFWDADRGLYVDHILEGQRRPAGLPGRAGQRRHLGPGTTRSLEPSRGCHDRFGSPGCPILGGQRDRWL